MNNDQRMREFMIGIAFPQSAILSRSEFQEACIVQLMQDSLHFLEWGRPHSAEIKSCRQARIYRSQAIHRFPPTLFVGDNGDARRIPEERAGPVRELQWHTDTVGGQGQPSSPVQLVQHSWSSADPTVCVNKSTDRFLGQQSGDSVFK